MLFLYVFFFIPMINPLLVVKIHRNAVYEARSSCAFIRNATFSSDSSVNSCIWECVHEKNCQTAVYYHSNKYCSMFDEICEIGHIQSSENFQSSVICYKKDHDPVTTCPETTTENQMNTEETTTEEMMINTTSDFSKITGTNEDVVGIWNTIAGGNSTSASPGKGVGKYSSSETPKHAFDGKRGSKYLNFGSYGSTAYQYGSGINTGFYLTPKKGPSLLAAVRFWTANDEEERDPLKMTVEGSNRTSSALIYGSSWTLIYNGTTGLDGVIKRKANGSIIIFSDNTEWYSSYRFLITSKRRSSDSVQYSEVELLSS